MSPVKGTCMQMCPKEEITMRRSRSLVHVMERGPEDKMVKCFRRSAAGCLLNIPHILRPPLVLNNTLSYLFNNVLKATDVPFINIYDFIDDRLKAIRQDATIQEVSNQDWMSILPPIIRFYAYAGYECFEYDVDSFDPFLNMKCFHECILKLVRILLVESNKSTDELCSEMVSLLLVANLGDYNVLQQALPFISNKNILIQKAMRLSISVMNGNFGLLFKTYNEYPTMHQCVIAVQLPKLRKHILKAMCAGFNCKNNHFPISTLTSILLHAKNQETIKECTNYCITVIDDKAELSKSSFNSEVDELRLKNKIVFNENLSTMILNNLK